jgi:hypothetical protein
VVAPELPPPPKKQRRVWPWVTLSVIVLFVVVPIVRVLVDPPPPSSPPPPPPVPPNAVGASNDLSEHDVAVFTGLGSHVQRFNAAAQPLITDYTDPTVSIFRWVRSAGRHIEDMQAAATAMEVDVLSIEDKGLRETLLVMSDTLRDEVRAIIELRNAVAHLDVRGERVALRHLRRAANERRQQALEMLDRLRPYVDADTLQQFLQAAAGT